MEAANPRRAFQTLDGLRGVGAFLVVMRHVPAYFGPIRVPESFLAVDLFYLVSGFVVAHAYGARLLAGGFFVDFMKTRVIRLYPLYAFGLALGIVVASIAVIADPAGWWNPVRLAEAIATGALMIPLFPGLGANGSSLDGPTWTLLPELIANAIYAAAIRFMSLGVLVAIILVCGAGVVFAEFHYGTLDVGYNATDFWAALARVGFSFFAGVLLFRFFGDRRQDSEWAAWACVAVLAALLAFSPSETVTPFFELGLVLLGFPALLVIAGRFEPSARTGRVYAYVGLLSYGVYILHQPMGNLARLALQHHVHVPGDARGLVFGAVFLAAVTGLAGWLDGQYDGPVRRVLRGKFLPARARSPA
ncbi:MAG TPA: acyltransferase [Caulobacteraceae bacterium]|jgi:peptidoglycan/LPS O-acetylase OafA/YrhL